MVFAKIDFINLLPFYVYIKKNLTSSQQKQTIEYKKSYPSDINKKFLKKQIDGAFISSIKSQKANTTNIGIVAKSEVLSVLSLSGSFKKDSQSDTSNVLAKILDKEGEVLIGDKALIYYFNNPHGDFVDLAQEWKNKHNLPFVFARLCFNKRDKEFLNVCENFVNTKVKIPQYILKRYAKRSGLSQKQIIFYLSKITYKIDHKEKLALKKFFKLAKSL